LNYGVTFSAPGQEGALSELDKLLEHYCFFSLPTLVHGDKQKEAVDQGVAAQDAGDATVVPVSVVTGDGKQVLHFVFFLLEVAFRITVHRLYMQVSSFSRK